MNVSKEVRERAVDYSLDSIKYICEEIGPRESGMPNERKAQEWLKNELLTNGWADEAEIEEFKVARHGLVGFTKIVTVIMLIAAALQFVAYFAGGVTVVVCNVISIAFSVLTFLMTLFEFLMYKPFIDPFLPQTTSSNVYAKYKSSGETKRKIIFSGHTDSAYEWTLMKIKPFVMVAVIGICFVGIFVWIALFIAGIILKAIPAWSLIITTAFVPFYIALYFFANFKKVVDGANDNLTGVLASVSVLKCLKESGIRFEHTEVDIVLTGSEEAGLRGATAWAKKHKEEIDSSGIETIFIALETLRDWDHLNIYTRDLTGMVELDKGGVKLLDKASVACGRPLKHFSVFFGASDCAAIQKSGLRATCLAGMDPTPANYYHNEKDTADNMDRKTYALGLDISLEAAEIFDRDGAPE